MSRPYLIDAVGKATDRQTSVELQNRPQRPQIALVVEALARAAARRDYRRAIEAAATPEAGGPIR
jgi:hypothetical protein